MENCSTLGDLRRSGYVPRTVREEMRANLLRHLECAEPWLDGILGYHETVVPELENAILAGHHVVFLGERGQGKTRMIRALVGLLDERIPAVAGCELNCDPLRPICRRCRHHTAEQGDATPVRWLVRDERYSEKLATPDVSMADLIGEVDPIKVAEGRYLGDEDTIHFGLVPRTNRGIFAINELPDLMEKVQVGLFNLMEERDVQIKGYKVRLPLDVVFVASANPEDYTSRGRIITPLKDRFDAQIRTHYPRDRETEIAIVEQEVPRGERDGRIVRLAPFLEQIVAQVTLEARAAPDVNQASGVSVRATINNLETLLANAERRAVALGEGEIVPRISDLHALVSSTAGKIEFEYDGEDRGEIARVDRLLHRAILSVFDSIFEAGALAEIVAYFDGGGGVEVSERMPAAEYTEGLRGIPGLASAVARLEPGESPGLVAASIELVLEGLHLHQKLNKSREGGRLVYRA